MRRATACRRSQLPASTGGAVTRTRCLHRGERIASVNSGAQHHYPAGLIGQFGTPHPNPKKGRTRDRKVFFATRQHPNLVASQRAATLGYDPADPRLYDSHTNQVPWASVDPHWEAIETHIPMIVSKLRDYQPRDGFPTVVFLKGLIPLVAQLFVRHPSYEQYNLAAANAEQRKVFTDTSLGKAPVNMSRLLHYNVLCGLLVDCSWCVVHTAGNLLSSDLGFAPLYNDNIQRHGYAVPLSRDIAICVCSRGKRFGLNSERTYLQYGTFTAEKAQEVNNAVAWHAPSAIFGTTQSVVARAAETWATQRQDASFPPPPALLFEGKSDDLELATRWLRLMHDVEKRIGTRPSNDGFDRCGNCTAILARIQEGIAGSRIDSSQPRDT